MENRDTTIRLFIGVLVIMVLVMITLNKPHNEIKKESSKQVCKGDSLQNVIDSLQSDINILEQGFDTKESRYSDVISEYEFGLSYIKEYHPNAYKDFHRIIGFKERYTIELEKENYKRLKSYEQYR